jgi:hypothetical protein
MTTFYGNPELKQQALERARAAADQVPHHQLSEVYWTSHRWCDPGVVCQKKDCDHRFYANEISVPVLFAYAERGVFLEMPTTEAKSWPEKIVRAIPVGVDEVVIAKAVKKFMAKVIHDLLIACANTSDQQTALFEVQRLLTTDSPYPKLWSAAANVAAKAREETKYYRTETRVERGNYAADAAQYFAASFAEPRYVAAGIARAARAAHKDLDIKNPKKDGRTYREYNEHTLWFGDALIAELHAVTPRKPLLAWLNPVNW